MPLKNYMEDVVVGELNSVLEKLDDVCDCQKCREDIVAYALNRLPAKYVVTDLGNIYTKLNQTKAQAQADVVVQLTEAAKVVKANPRH